jgi:hypothetical protein
MQAMKSIAWMESSIIANALKANTAQRHEKSRARNRTRLVSRRKSND